MEFNLNTVLIAIGFGYVFYLLLTKKETTETPKKLKEEFESISNKILLKQQEKTKTDVKEVLKNFEELQEEKFKTISDKTKGMTDLIIGMEKDRKESEGSQTQLINTMLKSANDISKVMNSPGPRGKWGQMSVRKILESAGMIEDIHFIHDKKAELGNDRPDFVINLADGKKLVLDAKVPFTSFEKAANEEDPKQKKILFEKHSSEARKHMNDLSESEYWNQFEDAHPYVIMCLPAESILYAAFQYDENLFKDGIEKKVYMCSPLSLLATLQVISQAHVHIKQGEDSKKIVMLAKELLKVVNIFNGHFKSLGYHAKKLFESFNKATGTYETKVLKKIDQISNMGIELEKGKKIKPVEMLEDGPRDVNIETDGPLEEISEETEDNVKEE